MHDIGAGLVSSYNLTEEELLRVPPPALRRFQRGIHLERQLGTNVAQNKQQGHGGVGGDRSILGYLWRFLWQAGAHMHRTVVINCHRPQPNIAELCSCASKLRAPAHPHPRGRQAKSPATASPAPPGAIR